MHIKSNSGTSRYIAWSSSRGRGLDAFQFFPSLTRELFEGEPLLARAEIFQRQQDRPLRPELSGADAAPQHPHRLMRGQPQAATRAADVEYARQRSLRKEPRCGRRRRRRHRFRHVHTSARRPCRLEHAARERPLGADLPQRQYLFADRELAYWTTAQEGRRRHVPG